MARETDSLADNNGSRNTKSSTAVPEDAIKAVENSMKEMILAVKLLVERK